MKPRPGAHTIGPAMLIAVCIANLVASCQGQSSQPSGVEPTKSKSAGTAPVDVPEKNAGSTSNAAVAEEITQADREPAGAIAAWDAVIWRYKYLARRKQQATIIGVVGDTFVPAALPAMGAGSAADSSTPVTENLVWLIDDAAGNGSLGIRVKFAGATPGKGQRVAVTGAWNVDSALDWYWAATSQVAIPSSPASELKEPIGAPGFLTATGAAPVTARPISLAKDNDLVRFTIVEAPLNHGDGWKVADDAHSPPVAILFFPGEQATYGGQDMRTSKERWQIKRGATYWLRIGRIRRPNPASIWLANARTAPVRDM